MFDLNLLQTPGFQTEKANVVQEIKDSTIEPKVVHKNHAPTNEVNTKKKKSKLNQYLLIGLVVLMGLSLYGIYSNNSSSSNQMDNKIAVSDVIQILLSETQYIDSIEFTQSKLLISLHNLSNNEILRIKENIESTNTKVKLINKNGKSSVLISFPWVSAKDEAWKKKRPSSLNLTDNRLEGNSSEIVSILLQLLDSKIISSSLIDIKKQHDNVFIINISPL